MTNKIVSRDAALNGTRMIAFILSPVSNDERPHWAKGNVADVATAVQIIARGDEGEGFFANDMMAAIVAGLQSVMSVTKDGQTHDDVSCHRVAEGMLETFKLSVHKFSYGKVKAN